MTVEHGDRVLVGHRVLRRLATAIGSFVMLAQERGWTVQVIATPAALDFLDKAAVEKQSGSPVKSQYSKPGAPRSPIPDAIVVAPATCNTINKWAQSISDTYALGVLAEITGLDTPIVVLPFVNSGLASRAPFRRGVESLHGEGVRILLGPGGFELHPLRTDGSRTSTYPWHLALDEVGRLAGLRATADETAESSRSRQLFKVGRTAGLTSGQVSVGSGRGRPDRRWQCPTAAR